MIFIKNFLSASLHSHNLLFFQCHLTDYLKKFLCIFNDQMILWIKSVALHKFLLCKCWMFSVFHSPSSSNSHLTISSSEKKCSPSRFPVLKCSYGFFQIQEGGDSSWLLPSITSSLVGNRFPLRKKQIVLFQNLNALYQNRVQILGSFT